MTDWPVPEIVDGVNFDIAVYRFGPDMDKAIKPVLVFMHGFPELAYSWRHQAARFADLGYPVLVPDMPGYGHSSKPAEAKEYSMNKLCGAMEDILDHYGVNRAVFVGHDWGALVLWSLPFYMPDRLLGCAGLNVPLLPPYPVDPITLFRHSLGDDMYIVRFQTDDGSSEEILEKDVTATFRFFMRRPGASTKPTGADRDRKGSLNLLDMIEAGEEAWGGVLLLEDQDLDVYVSAYGAGGFRGPVNWYRNMTANWQDQKRFLDAEGRLPVVDVPALMITADMDRACPAHLADGMPELCRDYTRHDLAGCGHWSMQEQPGAVNDAILNWLNKKFG